MVELTITEAKLVNNPKFVGPTYLVTVAAKTDLISATFKVHTITDGGLGGAQDAALKQLRQFAMDIAG